MNKRTAAFYLLLVLFLVGVVVWKNGWKNIATTEFLEKPQPETVAPSPTPPPQPYITDQVVHDIHLPSIVLVRDKKMWYQPLFGYSSNQPVHIPTIIGNRFIFDYDLQSQTLVTLERSQPYLDEKGRTKMKEMIFIVQLPYYQTSQKIYEKEVDITNDEQNLSKRADENVFDLKVVPYGKEILIGTSRSIYSYNREKATLTPLFNSNFSSTNGFAGFTELRLSPNGEQLLTTLAYNEGSGTAVVDLQKHTFTKLPYVAYAGGMYVENWLTDTTFLGEKLDSRSDPASTEQGEYKKYVVEYPSLKETPFPNNHGSLLFDNGQVFSVMQAGEHRQLVRYLAESDTTVPIFTLPDGMEISRVAYIQIKDAYLLQVGDKVKVLLPDGNEGSYQLHDLLDDAVLPPLNSR